MGRKKKKEIVVSAPPKLSQKPTENKKTENIEVERIETIEASQKFGKTFCSITISAGILLLIFSGYLIITGPLISSPETRLLFIVMLAFLGIVNTISGLFLMGRS